ncbi:MAG TPA: hypothetical protein VFI47_29700 [Acidimicrobiales bacterium]|nr:hypothetical protein [Acidimicrobiales bacterium]
MVVDPATTTHTDLTPLSMDEFRNAIERGDLRAGTPAATHAYAKIALAAFADGLSSPDVADALRVAAG